MLLNTNIVIGTWKRTNSYERYEEKKKYEGQEGLTTMSTKEKREAQ